jgi:hypothetical protein
MKKAMTWLVPVFFLVLGAVNARAGEVAPDLQEYWSTLSPTERVNAIFYLWERADVREMDITLHNMRATRQLRHKVVVEELQRVARETQPPLLAELEDLHDKGLVDGFTAYWITNCVVVKGTRETLEALAKHPLIEWAEAVPKMELIEPVRSSGRREHSSLDTRPPGISAVNAPQVWYELGYTGVGVLVANMDTGVDGTHPALASRWRGNHAPHEECWLDVLGTNFDTPHASGDHGTHVMGTICGTGSANSQFDTIGVAPSAEWIAMNAIGGFGADFNSDVLQGYQWFADPDSNPNTVDDVPDVIQNSWGVYGGFSGYTDCFQFWNESIIACEAAGTVVTFSAGNEGPSGSSHRSPANVSIDSVTFFSVGAVDAGNWPNTPHPIADFSSRGPSDCDPNEIKPEIVAPGVDVYSCIPNGQYSEFYSGTSMAGPHIAGVVALMREANPNADPRDIKSALIETAIDYGVEGDDNIYGHGMVDAYEAVLLISSDRGWIFGRVTNSTNGQPISGARVQAGDNYVRMTDAQGYYRISLPADSILPFSVSAFGFAQYNNNLSVADEDTITLDIAMTPVASGTLHGIVLIANGTPLENVTVSPQGIPVAPVLTDENGEFVFTLPGANNYSFEIQFHELLKDTSFWVETGETTDAVVQFSTPRSEALGPDGYGYRAYDRYDIGIAPQFEWTDMSNAAELSYPGITDASAFIEMPFPFVFYGNRYDSMTVNENGWVAPGEDPDRRNANTGIPSPQGPAGMLALCWDNLVRGVQPVPSRVLTRYDQAHGVYTIQYDHMYFVPITGAYLTAQIKIFDQEVWPTPTGDCEILFLYDSVGVTNSLTVGIENPAEADGLQMQFNTGLSASAFPVERGSAVLFTTRSQPRTFGNITGVVTAHPPLSGAVPNGVRLGNLQGQVFVDGSFAFTTVFSGPRTVRVQIPGYETAMTFGTIPTNGTVDVDVETWRLDPPRNLGFTRTNDSLFMTWEVPESVGGNLDELQNYIVHIDSFYLAETTNLFYRTRIPTGDQGHFYWLTAMYEGGESGHTDTIFVTWLDADNVANIPTEFGLAPAYPNPFNPTTSMEISLPMNTQLSLRVYDVTGRVVATVAEGQFNAGVHNFTWNAAGFATGVYFARLESPLGTRLQKLLLLK